MIPLPPGVRSLFLRLRSSDSYGPSKGPVLQNEATFGEKVELASVMQTLSSCRHGVGCREMNLVVLAARAFLSGGEDGCLQVALAQPVDWAAVERMAEQHSMMPPFAYALTRYGGDLVPREIRERLQQRLLLNSRTNLTWLQEWRRILLAFEAAGIPVISLKGPALASQAYRNIALREFCDLDLLIRPGEVRAAHDTLVREGYELRFSQAPGADAASLLSRNRQLEFVNHERGTLIDLHWGALHEMFSFQLSVDRLFRAAQVAECEGITFLSLSPEHLMLYLCAHGTKHCWLTLRDLCDGASYMRTATRELNWELCIREAEAANCELVLKHSLLLAQRVFGLELPSVMRNYCEDAKAQMVADAASSLLFRKDGGFGYREALLYHLAFIKDWRGRASFICKRVFFPEEPDWQELRLPRSLYFLYYAVRPVRLLVELFS